MKNRFLAFFAERYPFAVQAGVDSIERIFSDLSPNTDLRVFGNKLAHRLIDDLRILAETTIETSPFVSLRMRFDQEATQLADDVEGFFRREEIKASISNEERKWILRGMILTRAVDLTLKKIFLSSEIKYNDIGFQGKGFRSLGQEAIYAGALRLRRGTEFSHNGKWVGDVVAPIIRDLGISLAFTNDDVEAALNAQVGKIGPPTNGRDLHIGDFSQGVWPPAAPLAIATCSAVGLAAAFKLRNEDRVAVSFIGEGGTSLGEWHEAINLAGIRRFPVIFCIENNQSALSTPTHQQSALRLFADKAKGYGIPAHTIDGTDAESIAVSFAWASERARQGKGPSVIELVCMRMCGHAHHDDMLYLGHEPAWSFDYPVPTSGGYVDAEKYAQWAQRDPIKRYESRLIELKVSTVEEIKQWYKDAKAKCDVAFEQLTKKAWPKTQSREPLLVWPDQQTTKETKVEEAPPFSKDGSTYLDAIAQAVYDAMRKDERVFLLGEDVEPPYGNAFMMFRNAPRELWTRFLNTPIAESAIVGALVGMAAEGMRPIGEMQFNDFSASAFNQLVNNAAKLRFRTGIAAPFVLRMPWGGLRRAGPFHSQDTIPWYHRAFGLKIVAPSTPYDAKALFQTSLMENDDPVLFYEHIALYRDPSIKQVLSDKAPKIDFGKAAMRRLGSDLTLVSYGAYVHRIFAVAQRLSKECGIESDVIDLRSLVPVDFETVGTSILKTGRVLLVGEDSRTGGYLESIASKIAEGLFDSLDAPIRVMGARDTPIPYSPSLEDAFLASNEEIFSAALELVHW